MKNLLAHVVASSLLAVFSLTAGAAEVSSANTLTDADKLAGWRLLFDGKSLNGWHSFKKKDAPAQGWVIEGEWLKCVANGHGGDLVSDGMFDDFELTWEWRIPPKANNGIKYFITEERASAIGHEYQMIDDSP